VTQAVSEGVELAVTHRPMIVDGRSRFPSSWTSTSLTVGADRILNTLAATHLFKQDTDRRGLRYGDQRSTASPGTAALSAG